MNNGATAKIIRFKSRIGKSAIAFLIFCFAVMIIPVLPLFSKEMNLEAALMLLVILSLLALLLWLLFDTGYTLSHTHVFYRSGPLKGKIEITSIHTIISGKTLWVGLKPAAATKGLIVKYGKYDEIYFSRKTNKNFIDAILKINPDIKIIEGEAAS